MTGKLKKVFILILLVNIFSMCACYSSKMKDYYSDKNNFIETTGTITHIANNEKEDALYLGFSKDLEPSCEATDFKIVGKNHTILKQKDIYAKIEKGTKIEFVTAPKCWGDGYVMPIVAITVDGEELLAFEEGYANFMTWFEETH